MKLGQKIDFLRNSTRPKDLQLPPDECYVHFRAKEFDEYTVLYRWLRQWLKWYYTTALDPMVTVDLLFKAPVVSHDFRINQTEPTLVRFGLMWKLYDMVADLLRSPPRARALAPGRYEGLGFFLFGGTDGSAFLVWSVGLVQPKATKGAGIFRDHYPEFTVEHKTVGVADRLLSLDYVRRQHLRERSLWRNFILYWTTSKPPDASRRRSRS